MGRRSRGVVVAITLIALLIGCDPFNPLSDPVIEISIGDRTISFEEAVNLGEVLAYSQSDPIVVTITNTGLGDLELLSGVELEGNDNHYFELVGVPSPVLAPDATTSFSVTFAPSGSLGIKSAVVAIANNVEYLDGLFVFTVTGTGVADEIVPGVTISSEQTSPTAVEPIPITVLFSEPVVGFSLSDVDIMNGSGYGFTSTENPSFSFFVNPTGAQATVVVDIPAGVASDEAGNGNLASNTFSIEYNSLAPTVIFASSSPDPTLDDLISISITFSEEVAGFSLADLTVSNGNATNLQFEGETLYSVDINPTADGPVSVDIASGAYTSIATDLANEASPTFSRLSDRTPPNGSVTIDNDAAATNLTGVSLTIVANDGNGSGVVDIMASINAQDSTGLPVAECGGVFWYA